MRVQSFGLVPFYSNSSFLLSWYCLNMVIDAASGIRVHPIHLYQHRGAPFLGHDPVVCLPIVVRAAGSGEDVPQKLGNAGRIKSLKGIIGAGERRLAFDGDPLPSSSKDDCCPRLLAEVRQFSGAASGYERDHRPAG